MLVKHKRSLDLFEHFHLIMINFLFLLIFFFCLILFSLTLFFSIIVFYIICIVNTSIILIKSLIIYDDCIKINDVVKKNEKNDLTLKFIIIRPSVNVLEDLISDVNLSSLLIVSN